MSTTIPFNPALVAGSVLEAGPVSVVAGPDTPRERPGVSRRLLPQPASAALRQAARPLWAGLAEEMESDDNARGPEPHDDAPHQVLHRLVRHLVADGDRRAATLGRRARRTLDDMLPGTTTRPMLLTCRVGVRG
ncbi:hypothetical protein GCM10010232_65880 [Streptomyces amakusaensis]|uniref:Uncharacterized protein n=1 Tax=Streptomyces amakusaensis TaxID=67271 RepID=A0ABW0ARN5_9ACTN